MQPRETKYVYTHTHRPTRRNVAEKVVCMCACVEEEREFKKARVGGFVVIRGLFFPVTEREICRRYYFFREIL